MKKIFAAILAVGLLVVAPAAIWATGNSTRQEQEERLVQKYLGLVNDSTPYGSKAFNRGYQNSSPFYRIDFNEGAGLGYWAQQPDGTTLVSTNYELNNLYFGAYRLNYVSGVTSTIIPAMDATGFDVTADASAAASDIAIYYGGLDGASGRPLVIGTDGAFKGCLDMTITDSGGSNGIYWGFRALTDTVGTDVAWQDLMEDYLDWATIGNLTSEIYIKTSQADTVTSTDTTDNITDNTAVRNEYCVLVSAAGVVTYTVNGAAPTATAAYTFTDGESVVPWLHITQDTDIAQDTLVHSWSVTFQ